MVGKEVYDRKGKHTPVECASDEESIGNGKASEPWINVLFLDDRKECCQTHHACAYELNSHTQPSIGHVG